MRKKYGRVLKSFWNPDTGKWHLLVHEDGEREATAELLAGDPGLKSGDRVWCATGLRRSISSWRLID